MLNSLSNPWTELRRRRCASGAGALIKVEVRNGFGFGRIVDGRLVEVEAGIGVEGEIALKVSYWLPVR